MGGRAWHACSLGGQLRVGTSLRQGGHTLFFLLSRHACFAAFQLLCLVIVNSYIHTYLHLACSCSPGTVRFGLVWAAARAGPAASPVQAISSKTPTRPPLRFSLLPLPQKTHHLELVGSHTHARTHTRRRARTVGQQSLKKSNIWGKGRYRFCRCASHPALATFGTLPVATIYCSDKQLG